MPVKGRHAALPMRAPPYMTIVFNKDKPYIMIAFKILSLILSAHFGASSALTDAESLLKFKASLSNASALSDWSDMIKPCYGDVSNWNGVICVKDSVWGLQLETMGLSGLIDVESLANFPELRTLSFMNNQFDGPLPDFNNLPSLRSIYLSHNHFSGSISDDAFLGLLKLKKIYLANNEFEGDVPSSLVNLPKLVELRLEDNHFTGNLPNFTEKFTSFNVSNNNLEGPIPESLLGTDITSFSGNKGLCGQPLMTQCNISNSASTTKTSSSTNKPLVVSIIVAAMVVAVATAAIIVAAIILFNRRKRTSTPLEAPVTPSNLQMKSGIKEVEHTRASTEQSSNGKKNETTKLSFVTDDRERFDLHDLLKASAEILGSGCFGSSYKAALSTGPVMVVKRFKQMNNVGKEEFHEHMRRLGRLRHPNLLSLVAYYYRKEEKLLVTDFVHKGSLAIHLHGHQGSLDWAARLKIAKGIGKGLVYLYKELPSIIAAHGHLKSSNVVLNKSNEPLLTDYGLVPVINQENAHQLMVAYKSPEYLQLSRITKKTDVWSFGILILELLTGKFPANFLPKATKKSEEEDLASWVNRIPQEQWRSKVYDKELKATKKSEGEMMKLMKIGLSCCEGNVEKRLELKEAVERINEVKENDDDDDDDNDDISSSYGSQSDIILS
ncbi:pollen receptor-like kinase 1 [Mercurialis annua]|uniref:pollen receptor-like kinase 1 n=1 Tax=Mercurialis annua TaxID=3986 RepID=UPI002160DCEA|nr:pollen receptor-like kinase 1 [Mercurialis annua]